MNVRSFEGSLDISRNTQYAIEGQVNVVFAEPAIPCTLLTASSSTLAGVFYRPCPIDALNVLKVHLAF